MQQMTTDPFVQITKKIIKKDGISAYLPTLFFPIEHKIMVLEGIPENVNHEKAAKEWVKKEDISKREYYIAFKVKENKVKIIHHYPNGKTISTIITID